MPTRYFYFDIIAVIKLDDKVLRSIRRAVERNRGLPVRLQLKAFRSKAFRKYETFEEHLTECSCGKELGPDNSYAQIGYNYCKYSLKILWVACRECMNKDFAKYKLYESFDEFVKAYNIPESYIERRPPRRTLVQNTSSSGDHF